jgi:small GTP-binding protein
VDLREYESAKFDLADILRTAASSRGEGAKSRIAELLARLARDQFNLVVVGHFSRGKTTLMNAILGTDRLPTGVLPLTSVITHVVYGSRERAQVEFEHGAIGFDVPMDTLADYITEHGNPGNVRQIRAARISLPVEILRRGFSFVDTPGLGSATEENTRTTERFLPEADAAIMVSAYDGPLTEEELRVAERITRSNRKLFFVLNKRDMVAPAARREVEEYVQARLTQACGRDLPHIFSLSAREGLAARLSRDPQASAASGVDEFEVEVTRFLIEDKNREFLRTIYGRTVQLLDALEGEGVEDLRHRLVALTHRNLSPKPPVPTALEGATSVPSRARASIRMEDCSICVRMAEASFSFLRQYQYALVSDAGQRERFAASGGLCGTHSSLYASVAADRDICVALAPLMKRLAAILRAVGEPSAGQPGAPQRALFETMPECILCRLEDEAELLAIAELAGQHDGFAADGRNVPSLCVPHLREVALQLGNRPTIHALADRQCAAAERLAEDMDRYVLRHDALRRGLASDEETRAARRAIAFVAGYSAVAARHRVRR